MFSTRERVVDSPASILSFIHEGGGAWPVWHRYLAIDGKKAFHIGSFCNTCTFFFTRLEGATRSVDPAEVGDALNKGVTLLGDDFLTKLEQILPTGEYIAMLSEIRPKLVAPGDPNDYFTHEQVRLWGITDVTGLPHYPATKYYRLATKHLGERRGLFEFLIPSLPERWLDQERVDEYAAALAQGSQPTAIALSVLDVKGPAIWEGDPDPDPSVHYCLAHYLVDGHHKVMAAAQCGQPITLLSYLALKRGISSNDDIQLLLKRMGE